jgi:diguanylate cyclase (GGDEF)-like protein
MSERKGLPTLRRVLSRMHLRVTLFAVAMAGLLLLVTGAAVMRGYAQRNLVLIAQSASYSVEPAVVFEDREAIAEALRPFAGTEGVSGLVVARTDGRVIARWSRPGTGIGFRAGRLAGRMLFPQPTVAPIGHAGVIIGEVRVYGDAGGMGRYLLTGFIVGLACLVLTALVTLWVAARLQRSVVEPLADIARVAHAVRSEQALGLRAPEARIAEINSLGRDFNALLSDLESWQNQLRTENNSLAHLATHDVLTGLANRVLLEARLEKAIEVARPMHADFVLLYMDANHFKDVNDLYGHAAGDALLVAIAQRIRNCVRRGDLAARVGGDEFAIVASPPAGQEDAETMIARLVRAMEAPIVLPGGQNVQSSLSIGIAMFPRDGTEPEMLLKRADESMYAAKQNRRDAG